MDFNQQLGERLRSLRRLRGWSLHDVAELSAGEFKASVLGAYERGDRALTVARLHRLAEIYDVPITWFLPGPEAGADPEAADSTAPAGDATERLLRAVISLRRSPGEPRVRRSDLAVLAAVLPAGSEPEPSRS